jgi:hypothetical protein
LIVSTHLHKLISFLKDELVISSPSVEMALKHVESDSDQLPMILWQYGLIDINQLDSIYEWIERAA